MELEREKQFAYLKVDQYQNRMAIHYITAAAATAPSVLRE
jgi:predicted ferric reductase